MDPKSTLTLVGLSHRTAAVAVRERYVVSQADLPACLSALLKIDGVSEAFVLSTCNRTEALIVAPRGVDVSARVRAQLFRNIEAEQAYAYEDVQALIHVFRVAAGLDSVVLGESEVLAQIKRGTEAAQAAQTLGPLLRPLLQQALHVGKRVRAETDLGQGTLSVARVGIDVATRVFGHFEHQSALVIGAGETGVLVAKHLRDLKIGSLAFANRTLERAQAVAGELNATAHGLDELPALVARADIVIACVEGQTATLDASAFDRRLVRRRDKPLLVIDLSMPRAIAADVAKVDRNVLVYDLEDLSRVVRENEKGRNAAVEGTHEILVTELHKFLSLRTYAAFSPAIAVLRERFERVREETLDALADTRSDPAHLQLAHEITRKLLDVALDQMKESARHTRSAESLDREYQRFLESL
jgi:glutamyl-tRNA reductase